MHFMNENMLQKCLYKSILFISIHIDLIKLIAMVLDIGFHTLVGDLVKQLKDHFKAYRVTHNRYSHTVGSSTKYTRWNK